MKSIKFTLHKSLAALYEVDTKVLNQAVVRNVQRFPPDFAFKLTQKEYLNLRSQFVTSSLNSFGGRRYLPYVFSEHGILMLSSVLRSEKAVQVNIQIMRAFMALRESLSNYKQLREKIEEMESKYDQQFQIVFQTIKKMIDVDEEREERKIGFKVD